MKGMTGMQAEDVFRKYIGETLGIEFRNGLMVYTQIQKVFPERGPALLVMCGDTDIRTPDGARLTSLESFVFAPSGIEKIIGLWSPSDPRMQDGDELYAAPKTREEAMDELRKEIEERDSTIEELRTEIEELRNGTIGERKETTTPGQTEKREGTFIRKHPTDETRIEMGNWSEEGGMKVITSVRMGVAHRLFGDDVLRVLENVKSGEWIEARVKGKADPG